MPPRDPKVVSLDDMRWKTGLQFNLNADGAWKATSLHNLQLVMHNHPALKGLYWYDEFADQIFIGHPLPDSAEIGDYPRPVQDHDETALAAWMNHNALSPSIPTTRAALHHVAFSNPRNPIREWAGGLAWDGEPRIDNWLTYLAGEAAERFVAQPKALSLAAE